jgi:putative transposase
LLVCFYAVCLCRSVIGVVKLNLPQRKLQRLKDYNYFTNGSYFLTLCVQNRINLFGNIENDLMILNNAGKMIERIIGNLILKYENIKLDTYIVMPNHFHCIVTIFNSHFKSNYESNNNTQRNGTRPFPTNGIPTFMRDFKSITTCQYIKLVKNDYVKSFDKHIWQKSYHDHIIRNYQEYLKIFNYIESNQLKWVNDKFYTP